MSDLKLKFSELFTPTLSIDWLHILARGKEKEIIGSQIGTLKSQIVGDNQSPLEFVVIHKGW